MTGGGRAHPLWSPRAMAKIDMTTLGTLLMASGEGTWSLRASRSKCLFTTHLLGAP